MSSFHHTKKATSFAWCFKTAECHLGNRDFFYSKEAPLFTCVLFTLKDNLLAVFWFSVYGISLVNFCPVSEWNQCFISLSTICYFCGSRSVMNLLFIIIKNKKNPYTFKLDYKSFSEIQYCSDYVFFPIRDSSVIGARQFLFQIIWPWGLLLLHIWPFFCDFFFS